MKTKILIAAIMGALMLFSFLATADYSGDHPLTNYERGGTYGNLVYVTVEDGSKYTCLLSDGSNNMQQDLTIDIPEGATIKTARLYNYYKWSTSGPYSTATPGNPAEATLTFDGFQITGQNPSEDRDLIPNTIDYGNGMVQYWDTKGQEYETGSSYAKLYDFPCGTFAWDVTDLIDDSGTYTATITNADSSPEDGENFCTYGFGLLVVYDIVPDTPKPIHRQYWIMEGHDQLKGDGTYETPENAIASAYFIGGVPQYKNVKSATLTTVAVSADSPEKNNVSFNGVLIGNCNGLNNHAIAEDSFEVNYLLEKNGNIVNIHDRNDYMSAANAFLVVETEIL
ncbi:MAG: DUF3344 domain-containing protein [Methanosarcinales archaeon]|nr:DUF3344 domain-containing protein [Methanosarcinales archaeon]